MNPPVRLLENTVVDQIAAGEVVERPASVVKELVENALDAGATTVDVRLVDGGRTLVRVSDDGHGMGRQDALLAIERHATSKIRTLDDLRSVRTLGFRGEAVPSIAAVSSFQLTTRAAEDEAGTRIRIEQGVLRDVRPIGAAPGTVIEVRDLFKTLPARREFLRSAPTELSHALEVVSRIALIRPDVAFTVKHDDRVLLRAPAVAGLIDRAVDVLGPDPREATPIDDGPLRGWLAPLSAHRAGVGQGLHLYVQGRWIRDRVIRAAVAAAFRDRIPPGRHPLVLLDLTLPEGGVDVNVHPTKSEVRFRDPAGVAARVTEALERVGAPVRPRLGAVVKSQDLPLFSGPVPTEPRRVSAMPPDDLPPVVAEPDPVPPPPKPTRPPAGRVVGLAHRRYVIVEDLAGILVLDGSRALRRRAVRAAGPGPRLLVPIRVSVSPAVVSLAKQCEPLLEGLGLSLHAASPTDLVIRAVPASLADVAPRDLLLLSVAELAASRDPRSTLGDLLPAVPVGADDVPAVLEEGGPVTARWSLPAGAG